MTPHLDELRKAAEIWADLPGYVGRFSVSNLGRVKSIRADGLSYVLKLQTTVQGYQRVALSLNGYAKSKAVHRLVLLSFRGPPVGNQQCAHLNGVRADNRLENLMWVSPKENSSHKKLHGTHQTGEKHNAHKLTEAQILDIRRRYRRVKHSESNSKDLAIEFGVSKTTINAILKRTTWDCLPEETTEAKPKCVTHHTGCPCHEAKLAKRLERYEEALRSIAALHLEPFSTDTFDDLDEVVTTDTMIAREALKESL